MIKKDLISKVKEVIEELEKLEKHYRIESGNALLIDDQLVFQEV